MSDQQPLPWMKIWVSDFIAKTVMWPGVAAGLYAQLLILEWASGPLPNDDAKLAAVLKYDRETFTTAWAVIRTAFESTADGHLVNRALEVERAEAYQLHAKLSDAGKAGAKKLWKDGKRNGQANGEANGFHNGQANGQANGHQHHVQRQHLPPNPQTREEGDARGNSPANMAEEPPYFCLSKDEVNGWREVRAAYPKAQARPTNIDWGKASRYACTLVRGNRATWHSLLISTRNYADYCASTQVEPMSVVAFFGSSGEHWLSHWPSAHGATAERNEHARH